MIHYYIVPELKMLAKKKSNSSTPYIFNFENWEWERDNHTFTDIFIGYDGYGIGNYGSLPDYEEITKEQYYAKIDEISSNSYKSTYRAKR